jgi:hypothetical protein
MAVWEEQEPGQPVETTGHQAADQWAAKEHAAAREAGRGCWHCWGIAEGIAAQKRGHVLAYGTPLPEGTVWLGDLAGMEVVPVDHDGIQMAHPGLQIAHRCGTRWDLPHMEGMVADGSAMLGNLVAFAVQQREGHACPPHVPSEEHKALVRRWQDASGRSPLPVTPREGDPFGELEKMQLRDDDPDDPEKTDVIRPIDGYGLYLMAKYGPQAQTEGQRLFQAGQHAEAEPQLAREILGDEAAEQLRPVDGLTGCTPTFVPGGDVTVECLGDNCTGCSDPQCHTARADGGDV